MPRLLLLVVTLAFAVLTALALRDHGYWGIIAPHFQTFGAGQVFADLVIALSLAMAWMWRDARRRGRSPWPWIVATLLTGSFGPLAYVIVHAPWVADRDQRRAAGADADRTASARTDDALRAV